MVSTGGTLLGLHHVTALAGDPRRNLDFYTRIPGMRLVKRTVNFDDPAGHHFYYGAGTGAPGTLLTFFPWVAALPSMTGRRGVPGSGQIGGARMAVPLAGNETPHDPDGIPVEFAPGESPSLQSVTLREADAPRTFAFLRDVLDLKPAAEDRLDLPDGSSILVRNSPDTARGRMAAGVIHHVALRVADEDAQLAWREKLMHAGLRVSPVKDRLYFHSIYFREPGGVLLEIATDGPGFLIDEAEDRLGQRLCLPPWLEPSRESIERRLPPLAPASEGAGERDA